MTTWQLIRKLIRMDATGDKQVMISVITTKPGDNGNEVAYDACGFIDDVSVEADDGAGEFIILEAVDA